MPRTRPPIPRKSWRRFKRFARRFSAAIRENHPSWLTCLAVGASVLAAGTAIGTSAFAQELIPGETLLDRFDRRQVPVGAVFGPWSIFPSLRIDETFNSNIFATPGNRRADAITNIYAGSKVDYASGPDKARLLAQVTDHVYAVNGTETEWEGTFGGTYDRQIHDDLQFNLGGDAQRFILQRGDPTGINGLTPTTFWVYDAFSGLTYGHERTNLVSMRVGANQTSYDTLKGVNGPVNTSQRDFHELYVLGTFNHYMFDRQKLFAELRPNIRTYDHEFDQGGFRRSSDGGQATFGGVLDLDSIFLITLSTGLQVQRYDDPRFGTVTEPNGTVKLSWWPTLLTNISMGYDHSYQEGFFGASPGAIRNYGVLRVDHELQRNLILSASAAFEAIDVVRSPQSLNRKVGEAKLQYQIADGFSIAVDYQFIHQSAAGGLTPFDQNLVTASIKKLF